MGWGEQKKSQGMTKTELVVALNKEASDGGGEEGHMNADALLLAYINDEEISDAFRNIPDKWYS